MEEVGLRRLKQHRSADLSAGFKQMSIYAVVTLAVVGPIYWLPAIEPSLLRWAKSILLAISTVLALAYFILTALGARRGPRGLSADFLLLLTLVGLSGLLSSLAIAYSDPPEDVGRNMFSYLLTIIYMMAVGVSLGGREIEASRTLRRALLIYPMISSFIVLAGNGVVPDYEVPVSLLIGQNENALELINYRFSGNGLGGARTGWGAATAVASVMLLGLLDVKSASGKLMGLSVFLVTSAALYTIGARGAFGVFIVGSAYVYMRRSPGLKKYLLLAVGVVTMSVAYAGLPQDSRFHFELSGMGIEQALDVITSTRYSTWKYGVGCFLEEPFRGMGVEACAIGGRLGVHNAWISVAAASGALGLVPSLCLLGMLINLALRRPKVGNGATDVSGAILAGVLVSMVEPGFPFGAFFNSTGFFMAVMMSTSGVHEQNTQSRYSREIAISSSHA